MTNIASLAVTITSYFTTITSVAVMLWCPVTSSVLLFMI